MRGRGSTRRPRGAIVSIQDLQGLLGPDAPAGASARTGVPPFPRLRHPSEPDEPEYVHDLRADVHAREKARKIEVDVSVLFADLRGYTALSQALPTDVVSSMLDVFYDECAAAIWEFDGLLNKTIGDAIMAIFNFPIRHADHAERAVLAAKEIQRRFRSHRELFVAKSVGLEEAQVGVGIGIDSGEASFGEFGRSHRDLTAIGTRRQHRGPRPIRRRSRPDPRHPGRL